MTAYLTSAQLRELADIIGDLPVEVRRADLDLGDDSTVAVWWSDDPTPGHLVRVMDADENEAAG